MVDMIDVSNFEANISWNEVGVQAAYSHAYEYGPNTQSFPVNWQGMKENNIQRGAYCFARPTDYIAVDQANKLVDYVVGLGFEGSDFFVLDAEVPMTADWAIQFLETVKGRGYPIAFYASTSFLSNDLNNDSRLFSYPLIVADYGPNDGQVHPISGDLSKYKLWAHQYTSVGSVPSIPKVDCNIFINQANNPSGEVDMTPEEHTWLEQLATGVPAYGIEAAHVASTKNDQQIVGTTTITGMQPKLDLIAADCKALLEKPAPTLTLDEATINSLATAIAQAVGTAVASAVVTEIKTLRFGAQ